MNHGMQMLSHFGDERMRTYMQTAAGPGAAQAPEQRIKRWRRR